MDLIMGVVIIIGGVEYAAVNNQRLSGVDLDESGRGVGDVPNR